MKVLAGGKSGTLNNISRELWCYWCGFCGALVWSGLWSRVSLSPRSVAGWTCWSLECLCQSVCVVVCVICDPCCFCVLDTLSDIVALCWTRWSAGQRISCELRRLKTSR